MKVNVPNVNIPRLVIVGGGFAGVKLAEKLKGKPVQIVMFDRHNYHTFQPLLYQVATGGLEPDSIAFPIRKWFKNHERFYFRMAEVNKVHPGEKYIETSIGTLEYDYLVIATGSHTNYFGMERMKREAFGMKNIPEALNLRSLILQHFESALLTSDLDERDALTNFVVVGGGPTGVETAGALAELRSHILPMDYPELDFRYMDIHLMEAGDCLLDGFSDKSSGESRKALEKMGVNVWLNCPVEDYDGLNVKTAVGKDVQARTVIWAAGVTGATLDGFKSDTIKDGRILVDEFNRVKGSENIFALGDVARMETEEYPQGHPMVAQPAIQQGEHLANNLIRIINNQELKPFRYKDKGSMATIGRNKAVADIGKGHFRGFTAWFLWMVVHLFSLAGFRNKLVVFVNWFWNYITYDKGTRLIIRPFRKKPNEAIETEDEIKQPVPRESELKSMLNSDEDDSLENGGKKEKKESRKEKKEEEETEYA